VINLLYLGIAVAAGIVASVIVLVRNRRPRSLEAGVQEFARELRALAPGPVDDHRPRRRRVGKPG